MLVGEVRWATTGFGVSWKWPGGRAWSSAPTNVSKNRHVRRAINRSARVSSDVAGAVLEASRGMLIHCATAGDAAQIANRARAAGHASGRTHTTAAHAAVARTTPPAIRR